MKTTPSKHLENVTPARVVSGGLVRRKRHPAFGTVVDFHQLDECDCGGTLDHWKTYVGKGEYYCRWDCQKCGDSSGHSEDADGNKL